LPIVFITIQLIISEHALPSMIISCCKPPNYDFRILQGSVATVLR